MRDATTIMPTDRGYVAVETPPDGAPLERLIPTRGTVTKQIDAQVADKSPPTSWRLEHAQHKKVGLLPEALRALTGTPVFRSDANRHARGDA